MSDTVPPGRRIDRGSLERIIQRAAELQASERDLSEGLTEVELYQLGEDVGLSPAHIKRAMLEERTRAVVRSERGLAVFLAGPAHVHAERVVAQPAKTLSESLHWWMDEGEVLQVKRRFPDVTVWETKRGALAAMKRSFRSGHSHQLARAFEVNGAVTDLGDHRTHVRLTADLSNHRREHITGATVLVTAGAVTTVVAMSLGVAPWAAAMATPLAAMFGYGVARSQWQEVHRMEIALEQVLDRLEHGEIQAQRAPAGPRPSAFLKIADEIRKSFGA
jgi:hypothetical protein